MPQSESFQSAIRVINRASVEIQDAVARIVDQNSSQSQFNLPWANLYTSLDVIFFIYK